VVQIDEEFANLVKGRNCRDIPQPQRRGYFRNTSLCLMCIVSYPKMCLEVVWKEGAAREFCSINGDLKGPRLLVLQASQTRKSVDMCPIQGN
jgi:hypothetical protein